MKKRCCSAHKYLRKSKKYPRLKLYGLKSQIVSNKRQIKTKTTKAQKYREACFEFS